MSHSRFRFTASVAVLSCVSVSEAQHTLHVGPDQPFTRIEAALAAAVAGDTILVHPLANNQPYTATALTINTPRLTIRALALAEGRIVLSGAAFDYSGIGSIPRAIVQFNRDADDCVIEGFEFRDAHNQSHNAAGIRINEADRITVRSCAIHDNDMGIMSNGDKDRSAIDQRIEFCLIHHNGSLADPGQNHNLYLGGADVTLTGCEVHSSTTGHNVKSRAHITRMEYCYIHDSANREIDLVDAAGATNIPASDALLLGCIVSKKSPDMSGNRAVMHFGQDGGIDRTGTLYIVNSTIITPYVSPIVTLSSAGSHVAIHNTLFSDGDSRQRNLIVLAANNASFTPEGLAEAGNGTGNAHFGDFNSPLAGARLPQLKFADLHTSDFRVAVSPDVYTKGTPLTKLSLPLALHRADALGQYKHPQSVSLREDAAAPIFGACEAVKVPEKSR